MAASGMVTVTCDHSDCKSYYRHHPTAQGVSYELKQRGWQVVESPTGEQKHFCQAHKIVEIEKTPYTEK